MAWTDERIIGALAALREELVVPQEPLALTVRVADRTRRLGLVAAAIVAVIVATTLAIAPARDAVADWLGIGSTEVRVDPDGAQPAPGLPSLADDATVVDRSRAEAALGRPLPPVRHPDTAAEPELAIPVEGGVLVRWAGRDETLWVHAANDESPLYFKKYASDTEVTAVDGLGDAALWIGGDHVLETPGRALAAEHVLLWIDDGLELRLEGDLARAEMVAIAHGLS